MHAGSGSRSGGGWDGWVQLADGGAGCTASVGCAALSLWLGWSEVVWDGGTVSDNEACFGGYLRARVCVSWASSERSIFSIASLLPGTEQRRRELQVCGKGNPVRISNHEESRKDPGAGNT